MAVTLSNLNRFWKFFHFHFNYHFTANLSMSLKVTEFWRSVKTWQFPQWVWRSAFSEHSVNLYLSNLLQWLLVIWREIVYGRQTPVFWTSSHTSCIVTVWDHSFATDGPRLWNTHREDVISVSLLTTLYQETSLYLFYQSYPDTVL